MAIKPEKNPKSILEREIHTFTNNNLSYSVAVIDSMSYCFKAATAFAAAAKAKKWRAEEYNKLVAKAKRVPVDG